METLTINSRGTARREVLDGEEYLVVPMTSIVPGVLNGSKGSLFYPLEEIQRSTPAWDKIPITIYHPIQNGRNVSVHTPGILEKQGVGFIKGSRTTNKLTHEGWFNVKRLQSVEKGQDVYRSLIHHHPIELSTGLFTDNESAKPGSSFLGRSYQFVARNYRPDHMAILPDQVGACSLNDGCGVLINQETVANAWVTLDSGQRVFIGPGGKVLPSGPKQEKGKAKKAPAAAKEPKQTKKPEQSKELPVKEKGSKSTSEKTKKYKIEDTPAAERNDLNGKYKVEGRTFHSQKDAKQHIKDLEHVDKIGPKVGVVDFVGMSNKYQNLWAEKHLTGYKESSMDDQAKMRKELIGKLRIEKSQADELRPDGTKKNVFDYWAESAREWEDVAKKSRERRLGIINQQGKAMQLTNLDVEIANVNPKGCNQYKACSTGIGAKATGKGNKHQQLVSKVKAGIAAKKKRAPVLDDPDESKPAVSVKGAFSKSNLPPTKGKAATKKKTIVEDDPDESKPAVSVKGAFEKDLLPPGMKQKLGVGKEKIGNLSEHDLPIGKKESPKKGILQRVKDTASSFSEKFDVAMGKVGRVVKSLDNPNPKKWFRTNSAACTCEGKCKKCKKAARGQAHILEVNAGPNQMRCGDSGKFLFKGAGTGKGPVHKAAKDGKVALVLQPDNDMNPETIQGQADTHTDDHQNPASSPEQLKKIAKKIDLKTNATNNPHGYNQYTSSGGKGGTPKGPKGKTKEAVDKTNEAAKASKAAGGETSKTAEKVAKNIEEVYKSGKNIQIHGHELLAKAHDSMAAAHYSSRDKHQRTSSHITDEDVFGGQNSASLHDAAAIAHLSAADSHRAAGKDKAERLQRKNTGTSTNNQATEGESMTRKELLATLTANCSSDEDIAALNGLSDTSLISLVGNAQTLEVTANAPEDEEEEEGETVSEDTEGDEEESGGDEEESAVPPQFQKNAGGPPSFDRGKKAGKGMQTGGKQGYTNNTEGRMTFQQALAKYGTPEEKGVWNHAVQNEKKHRISLVQKLVANIDDDKQRQLVGNKLLKEKATADLEEMVSFLPTNNQQTTEAEPAILFHGAGGPPVANRQANDDILPLPTMNYSTEEKQVANG